MAIYRRLFFNNLDNLFGKNFPVTRRLLGPDRWRALIRAFMIHHRPVTPLFPEIGREMVRFLEESGKSLDGYPPFVADLARFEYLETAVRLDENDIAGIPALPDGDLIDGIPVVNPSARLAQFTWPVHEINEERLPDSPSAEATFLVVWRRRDDRVSSIRVNPVSARLIQLLQENSGASGLSLLTAVAGEMNHPRPEVVVRSGRETLDALRRREIILGARPSQRSGAKDDSGAPA